jgi:hypothetical protein
MLLLALPAPAISGHVLIELAVQPGGGSRVESRLEAVSFQAPWLEKK